VLWSVIAVTVICCVTTGIALSIGFIHGATAPAPTGEYIRLVILCVTFWGPMYLLFCYRLPAFVEPDHPPRLLVIELWRLGGGKSRAIRSSLDTARRSFLSSGSNSAMLAMMLTTASPVGVLVSTPSRSDRTLTPR
jgi:hypothetical protein